MRHDKHLLRKSLWGSISRVIGVGLGVGAGQVLHSLAGDYLTTWVGGISLAVASFIFMMMAEYRKESSVPKQ